MENRQTVTIELDKVRRLRYTLNALAIIKEKTGVNLFDATEQEVNTVASDPGGVRTLIWAGLLDEDAELTEEQVGQWIDMENLGMASERFAEALAVGQRPELRPTTGRQKKPTP